MLLSRRYHIIEKMSILKAIGRDWRFLLYLYILGFIC